MKKIIRKLAWWFVVPAFFSLFVIGMILISGAEAVIESRIAIFAGVALIGTSFFIFLMIFLVLEPDNIWRSIDELEEERKEYKAEKKMLNELRVKYVKYFEKHN